MNLRFPALAVLACLLAACASTSVKETWKAPDFAAPVGQIAVVALDGRGWLREGFENRLGGQLVKAGAQVMTTFDRLTLARIKEDRRAAAESLMAGGAKSVLRLKLNDKNSTYREIRPGGERWAPVVTGVDPWGWYGAYEAGFMDMSPTYGMLTEIVSLEATLFDLKTGRRLWSGWTKTVLKDDADRLGEMDRVTAKIAAAMRADGIVP